MNSQPFGTGDVKVVKVVVTTTFLQTVFWTNWVTVHWWWRLAVDHCYSHPEVISPLGKLHNWIHQSPLKNRIFQESMGFSMAMLVTLKVNWDFFWSERLRFATHLLVLKIIFGTCMHDERNPSCLMANRSKEVYIVSVSFFSQKDMALQPAAKRRMLPLHQKVSPASFKQL